MERMDYLHIHWLQWLVQFGGTNITLIFFRAMVSLGCAGIVVNEEQDFSVF